MWKLTLKNVAANKIRLALTGLAIVLGVGFISAANILSDGLREAFGGLTDEIVEGTDLQIEQNSADAVLTQEDVDAIAAVEGIRVAEGAIDSEEAFPITSEGEAVIPNGPPVVSFSWVNEAQLNRTTIEEGEPPTNSGEFVLDLTAAKDNDFVIGETYDVAVPTQEGIAELTLVGTVRFGSENATLGAVLMGFETSDAQRFFEEPGQFSTVSVAIDGSRPVVDIKADVEELYGDGFLVQDTADLNAEQSADFNSGINIFAWVLRSFAIIALFVSIFIIVNTFNIVMGQRVRELGLLRAVGATPKQIRRAVIGEALLVGLIASFVGLLVGLGLAYGMEGLLNAIGASLPEFDKPISVATVFIALFIGVGVTLVSAWLPARRAGTISPITAITGSSDIDPNEGRRSLIIGGVLAGFGALFTGLGLFVASGTANIIALLGFGAALLFVGITLLSPLVAAPVSRALGAPVNRIYGTPGRLATENAARNPKRTATTAAALMIGLSLVSMAFVVGQTLKSDLNELLESTVQSDYAAFPVSFEEGLVPAAVKESLEESPQFTDVGGVKYWDVNASSETFDGVNEIELGTFPVEKADALFDLDLLEGSFADVDDDSVALRQKTAEEFGVGLGDKIVLSGSEAGIELEVVALFDNGSIFSDSVVSEARWATIADQDNFDWVGASVADGVDPTDVEAEVARISASFPQVDLQSAQEYRESISGQVDSLLQVLSGFLGLAIFIAFIGIVNTMALSIFERTRELGLLRAVGMTRRQTGRMVRWEAAIVSGLGALLGAIIGIVFGSLVVIATPDEVFENLTIPWVPLALLVAVASFAGLIAGFLPARRAARLDVLDAIAQ